MKNINIFSVQCQDHRTEFVQYKRIKMNYGNKISLLREVLELSQEELAYKLSINNRTISYWENNQREISKKHLILLIKELGVNPFWIMWDSSKFANKNISSIEDLIRKELPEEFNYKVSGFMKPYYPDADGYIEVFYNGSILTKDLLDDFVYDENEFREKAKELINDIELLIPSVETLKDKMDKLKTLLAQKI